MERIWQINQVERISREKQLSPVLTERIQQAVQTINKYYGETRNPVADLGGFVSLVLNREEWLKTAEEYNIGNQPPEYIEEIENDNMKATKDRYYEILFLLSSDYGIYIFANDEVKQLIENK